jgi:hypothetical protein
MPTRNLLPAWYLVREKQMDKVVLKPGSFLSQEDLKQKFKHKYLDEVDPKQAARLKREGRTLEKDTVLYYPTGIYGSTEKKPVVAGVYLKQVIKQSAQDEALNALDQQMRWSGLKRPETRTAKERQVGNAVTPRELTIGVTHPRNKPKKLMPSVDTRKNAEHLVHLIPLWREIAHCYQKVLPSYFRIQNDPNAKMDPALKDDSQYFGGIPRELRQWLGPVNSDSIFSTLTLLRSCPASIHIDGNAKPWQDNFACLTSLGEKDEEGKPKFSGGRFCLIEYGLEIPILPGDLFIGQTTREWHYNTTPVTGVKYSVIGYYQPRLAKPDKDRSRLESKEGVNGEEVEEED